MKIRNNDVEYPFRQDSNFFWFTGINKPDYRLAINCKKRKLIIIAPECDENYLIWHGKYPDYEKMKQDFINAGLGQFGSAIAKNLSNRGAEVLAIDSSLEKVEGIKDEVSHAVALDATDKKALLSQNIQDVDAVVVAIGENFQALLLCTFLLIELKVKRIITRSMGNDQRRILEKMGVTEILSPEDEVGGNVAEMLINPNVVMCMQLPDDYEIVEVKAPSVYCTTSFDS